MTINDFLAIGLGIFMLVASLCFLALAAAIIKDYFF
jgi:hypothetical protein